MTINITDSVAEQVSLGMEIVEVYSEVYTQQVKESIYKKIRELYVNSNYSEDDIFFISVYNYWRYGFTTGEVFYFDLLSKNHEQKLEYIPHMDRLNYMHYLNKVEDEHLLANKYETYQLLKKHYGRDVIYIQSDSDRSVFYDFFSKHREFVIKPIGLAVSIGVRKTSAEEYDNNADTAFHSIIDEITTIRNKHKWAHGNGVIVEEIIKQGAVLAELHPASINSVRLTTIRMGDKINIFYPVLRIGLRNHFLCCGAAGSILAGIDPITGITETEGFTEQNHHYITHPDTGIPIKGIQLPQWEELCSLAKKLANEFPTLNYIGWDFAYSENHGWIVMEANENGEFLCQIAYQRGFFKELKKIINWESPKEYWWIGKYKNE